MFPKKKKKIEFHLNEPIGSEIINILEEVKYEYGISNFADTFRFIIKKYKQLRELETRIIEKGIEQISKKPTKKKIVPSYPNMSAYSELEEN